MSRSFTLLLALRAGLAAQSLEVFVVDASQRPVEGARVSVSNSAQVTAASGTSDAGGRWKQELPQAGRYRLTVSRIGFGDRTLAVDAPGAVTVQLAIATLEQQITVSTEAGQVQYVDWVAQRTVTLDRDEIRERTATALTELGTGEPGVEQLRTSSTMGSFFIRGLTGKNVAVYRDGVRYTTSAQRGGVSTFQNLIEPSHLDTVEFVRGPNSAQYGSDSVGGTVALETRPPVFGGSGGGRWFGEVAPLFHSATNGAGGNLATSYSGRRVAFTTNLAARRVNRFRTGGGIDSHAAVTRFLGLPSTVIGSERLPDTAFTQYGGMFHAQLAVAARQQLVAHYERGQQDGGKRYDQLLGGDGNLIADLRNVMADFGYLRLNRFAWAGFDQVTVTGSFNAQREERINQGGQGNPNGAITNQFERARIFGAQFQLSKRLPGRNEALFGGEGYHEKMTSPAFTYDPVGRTFAASRPRVPNGATYKIHGLFVQDVWSPLASQRVRVSGALRFGGATYQAPASATNLSDSLTANALSGRVGGVVRVADPVFVHASYSRGFRAPSMTDLGTLGIQGNGFFEANVNDVASRGARIGNRADDQAVDSGLAVERLRPEKTDNFDVGAQVRNGRVSAEVTAFWIRLNNTIVSQTLLLPAGAVGQALGDQIITRQLASGAVYVPIATQPVLVRANFTGARLNGVEQHARVQLTRQVRVEENVTVIQSEDSATGRAPDIEPGSPPTMANVRVHWSPGRRLWVEAYGTVADRHTRIPSISIADRRTGASRSRTNIANFFNNGARVRGLVANGILVATGETLAQVQNRVLGTGTSGPLFAEIPGWGVMGVRAGFPSGERSDVFVDFANLTDRNYRGIGWGMDGAGRSVTLKWRYRF